MKKQLFMVGMILITGISAAMPNPWSKDTKATLSEVSNTKISNILEIADTTAPKAPVAKVTGYTSSNTVKLSWSGATDNVGVTGYTIYRNGVSIATTTSTSYTVKSLTPSTAYKFTVKAKDAAGNLSASSNTVSVTTRSKFGAYCSVGSNDSSSPRFVNFKLGSINNSTKFTGGFYDFTALSTNLTKGKTYTVSAANPTFNSLQCFFHMYIDYNHNNVFEKNEYFAMRAYPSNSSISRTFTVPSNALLGPTRMRVRVTNTRLQYDADYVCQNVETGQVADYTINIVSSSTAKGIEGMEDIEDVRTLEQDTKELIPTEIKLYPNPVQDILNISNTTSEEYIIFDMTGKTVLSGKLERGSVNVSKLLKGTYMIRIGATTKKFIKQ